MATLKACLTDSDGIKAGMVDGSLNSDGIDDVVPNSDYAIVRIYAYR